MLPAKPEAKMRLPKSVWSFLFGVLVSTCPAMSKTIKTQQRAPIILRYSCKLQSKPGSPDYKLTVTSERADIVHYAYGTTTTALSQFSDDMTKNPLLDRLRDIYQELSALKLASVSEGKIGGYCKVELFNPQQQGVPAVSFSAPAANKNFDKFLPLFEWVKNLHQQHQKFHDIKPIFPVRRGN